MVPTREASLCDRASCRAASRYAFPVVDAAALVF